MGGEIVHLAPIGGDSTLDPIIVRIGQEFYRFLHFQVIADKLEYLNY